MAVKGELKRGDAVRIEVRFRETWGSRAMILNNTRGYEGTLLDLVCFDPVAYGEIHTFHRDWLTPVEDFEIECWKVANDFR